MGMCPVVHTPPRGHALITNDDKGTFFLPWLQVTAACFFFFFSLLCVLRGMSAINDSQARSKEIRVGWLNKGERYHHCERGEKDSEQVMSETSN